MNIFYLDSDPNMCSQMHCDKHVVKMCVEYAQLMSTAHYVLDGNVNCYKPTHINHPSAIWARKSNGNYKWLYLLWKELLDEYAYRYGKIHASSKLKNVLCNLPINIPDGNFSEPVQAMPDYYKNVDDSLSAYRNYYIGEKSKLFSWKNRETPYWIKCLTN